MRKVKVKNDVELFAVQWMVDPTSKCLEIAPNGRIKQVPWYTVDVKGARGHSFAFFGYDGRHSLYKGDWIVKWNGYWEVLSDESFKEKYEVVE